MKVKTLILSFLLVLIAHSLTAQTTVVREGIVDLGRVADAFYMSSRQYRDLKAIEDRLLARIAQAEKDLVDLRSQKARALEGKQPSTASEIDTLITQKNDVYQYLVQVELRKLDYAKSEFTSSDSFFNDLLKAIARVAANEGLLVVKKMSDDYLYLSPELDLTEKVIAQMLKQMP